MWQWRVSGMGNRRNFNRKMPIAYALEFVILIIIDVPFMNKYKQTNKQWIQRPMSIHNFMAFKFEPLKV